MTAETHKMTSDESSKLQTKYQELQSQKGSHYLIYAFGVIYLMLSIGMLYDLLTKNEVTSYDFHAIVLILIGFITGYFTIRLWLAYLKKIELVECDLSALTKMVIEGVIQAKREHYGRRCALYYFTVNSTEYEVDITSYTRFDTHQSVVISLTTSAQVIVSIEASDLILSSE